MGRWWSRRWRIRRQRGNDFGNMGTAFGLDAATEQAPLTEAQPDVEGQTPGRDRTNSRSVW